MAFTIAAKLNFEASGGFGLVTVERRVVKDLRHHLPKNVDDFLSPSTYIYLLGKLLENHH